LLDLYGVIEKTAERVVRNADRMQVVTAVLNAVEPPSITLLSSGLRVPASMIELSPAVKAPILQMHAGDVVTVIVSEARDRYVVIGASSDIGDIGDIGGGLAGLQQDLQALAVSNASKAADSAVVHKTGDETVAGRKTFSTAPYVPGTSSSDYGLVAASKSYVDSTYSNVHSWVRGGSNNIPLLRTWTGSFNPQAGWAFYVTVRCYEGGMNQYQVRLQCGANLTIQQTWMAKWASGWTSDDHQLMPNSPISIDLSPTGNANYAGEYLHVRVGISTESTFFWTVYVYVTSFTFPSNANVLEGSGWGKNAQ